MVVVLGSSRSCSGSGSGSGSGSLSGSGSGCCCCCCCCCCCSYFCGYASRLSLFSSPFVSLVLVSGFRLCWKCCLLDFHFVCLQVPSPGMNTTGCSCHHSSWFHWSYAQMGGNLAWTPQGSMGWIFAQKISWFSEIVDFDLEKLCEF